MSKGWVAVDLDGTLAKYDNWTGPGIIGEPIPAMLSRVKEWLASGERVKIFTARAAPSPHAHQEVVAIEKWCQKHLGKILPVTAIKDYECREIWDDRAITVEHNTGRILTRMGE